MNKNATPANAPSSRADELLLRIAQLKDDAESALAVYQAEYQKLFEARKAKALEVAAALAELEKDLTRHALRYKTEIFAGGDTRKLDHGTLLYQIQQHVRRSRDITPMSLEELGEYDAVKILKGIDWDEMEHWDDERLARAGTNRVTKEIVEYELARRPQ